MKTLVVWMVFIGVVSLKVKTQIERHTWKKSIIKQGEKANVI